MKNNVTKTATLKDHFVARSPEVKATYEAILQAVRKLGPVEEQVKKTSIHLVRRSAFAGIIAERTGFKKNKLVGRPLIEMGWKASRPLYSVLQSNKGIKLPNFENALTRYFEQLTV